MDNLILNTIKKLFILEPLGASSYILFNPKTLKIIKLPKKGLFSKISYYLHTRVFKDYVEFNSATELLAAHFRKQAFDRVQMIEKDLGKTTEYALIADKYQALFDDIEGEIEAIFIELKRFDSQERDLFMNRLQEMQSLLKRERARTQGPLSAYIQLNNAWKELEPKMQDIFTKEESEKVSFLKETGGVLASLVTGKKMAGKWASHLDVDGKSALYQEIAEKILQTILRDKEEISLFRAYIHSLSNPRESAQFLEVLRETFLAKYYDALDKEGEKACLLKLHLEKSETEKKALLLKYKKEEKEDLLNNVRKKLLSLNKEKDYSLPDMWHETQKTEWGGNLKDTKLKFNKLIKTIAVINTLKRERPSWPRMQEIRKELYDLGIIAPLSQELSDTDALLANPKLINTIEEIHRTIISEMAIKRRDLADIRESVESYADRLQNEFELRQLEETVKAHQKTSFVSQLIDKKNSRTRVVKEEIMPKLTTRLDPLAAFMKSKEFVASIADKLKLEGDPLYLSSEDLGSAFLLVASPYMTEGMQGKLPPELAHLGEDLSKAIVCIQEMNSSPLLKLLREKEKVRASMKVLEALLEPVNEVMNFLKGCQKEEEKKKELIALTKEKKVREAHLERVEEEQRVVEKDLSILEGIEAVIVELVLSKKF